jgi:hypothetical protein
MNQIANYDKIYEFLFYARFKLKLIKGLNEREETPF